MRLNQDSRFGSFLISVAARLARWVILIFGRTWKIEVLAGGEHLEAVLTNRQPVLISFWHNRSVAFSYFTLDRLIGGGLDVTLLASQSRDGELVTRVCRRWGLHTVRGSATRGGTAALRGLHRAITRRGSSPVMIPDGPQGPLYYFKVGVAVLAQTSKAPILPFGIAASKFWTLKSWDRMIVPRPFSRVTIAIGAPQIVERGLSADELEVKRQRLEELINSLTRQAEEAVGAPNLSRFTTP